MEMMRFYRGMLLRFLDGRWAVHYYIISLLHFVEEEYQSGLFAQHHDMPGVARERRALSRSHCERAY